MNKEIQIQTGDLTFDCRTAGNPSDELVILLHGFPDSAYMWIDLMNEISAQGFYCIAPNLRGYSQGARPKGRKSYSIENLTQDVMNIAASAGQDKFHLIGHDWGAVIGWRVVQDNPNHILSWTALSIPHYQAFGEAVVNDEQQKKMSGYMKNFQWLVLPEMGIRKDDFKLFRSLWKPHGKAEIDDYLSILRQKGALTAVLNYYRANYNLLRDAAKKQVLGDIATPTLFIWGEKDLAVGATGVENSHRHMTGYYKFLKVPGGHWLIQSDYAAVSTAIKEHLAKFKSSPA
jgi:pimeloyl-ACP methyl ester carboxylesterase